MSRYSYVINFSAARNPGTINYCFNFIKSLPKKSDFKILLILPPGILPLPQELIPEYVQIYSRSYLGQPLIRFLWEQAVLPFLLIIWRADGLLAPFDILPLMSITPVILGVKNPMPIHMSKGWETNVFFHHIRAKLQFYFAYFSAHKAKKIFYPSRFSANILGEKFNIDKDKIFVIHHGVDHKNWSIQHLNTDILNLYNLLDGKYILFVSMLYHYKRPDFLIEAFNKNISYFKKNNIKLAIVGGIADANFHKKLKKLISDNNLAESVSLLGFIDKWHLPHIYKGARAFCLPTKIETFGQPFAEAMACGLPIIAADIDIVREICADACLYFDADDCLDLSEKILDIFLDNTISKDLSARSLRISKKYSWDIEVKETFNLLTKIH